MLLTYAENELTEWREQTNTAQGVRNDKKDLPEFRDQTCCEVLYDTGSSVTIP